MSTQLTLFFYLSITTYYIYKKKPLITLAIYKKICNSSVFLILVTIKKIIDLKFETKYTSLKKINSTTKNKTKQNKNLSGYVVAKSEIETTTHSQQ